MRFKRYKSRSTLQELKVIAILLLCLQFCQTFYFLAFSMKTFLILILSCAYLVNAEEENYIGNAHDGPCPKVPSYEAELSRQDFEVWYTVYTSYAPFKDVRCATSNGTRQNSTRTHFDSVWLNSTGHRVEHHSDLDKVGPGQYVSSFIKEGESEPHQCNVVLIEDERGVMAWKCKEYENGTHKESASIYSHQRSVSAELLDKFGKHLKDHGAHDIELFKIDQENCSEGY